MPRKLLPPPVLLDSSVPQLAPSLARSEITVSLELPLQFLAVITRVQLVTTSLTRINLCVLDALLVSNVKLLSLKQYLAPKVFTALREPLIPPSTNVALVLTVLSLDSATFQSVPHAKKVISARLKVWLPLLTPRNVPSVSTAPRDPQLLSIVLLELFVPKDQLTLLSALWEPLMISPTRVFPLIA